MQKQCVLYDRICNNCGECDYCDLNPVKLCDNCGKCLENDKEYREIIIDGVILSNEQSGVHEHIHDSDCDCGCNCK